MTTWDAFVSRRQLQTQSFFTYHKVTNRESFLQLMSKICVVPPSEAVIESMFPKQDVEVVNVITSSQTSAVENDVLVVQEVLIDDNLEAKAEQGSIEEGSAATRSSFKQKARGS